MKLKAIFTFVFSPPKIQLMSQVLFISGFYPDFFEGKADCFQERVCYFNPIFDRFWC
jgi:hypothetical protein